MRILFCTLDYWPSAAGGAEHQAKLQADELAGRGHEVHVVCPRRRGEKSGMVGSVRVHRLRIATRRPFQTVATGLTLAWFLLRHGRGFDVVHMHIADIRTDVAVAVCKLLRRPVYVKLAAGGPAGDIGQLRKWAKLTRYFGLRHAACLQAISAEIQADIAPLRIPADRIAIIPNGLNATTFRPAADNTQRLALRKSLGFPEDRLVVLYLGRFAGYKGIGDLLEAWPAVRAESGGHLLFVGFVAFEDPYPIPDGIPGVEVREWASNPVDLYQAADVFVQPSHVEGMSNSLLEAMACGLPVVCTSVGAAPQMVSDGEDGLMVKPGDPAGLSAALTRVLTDAAARTELGAAAVETVRSRYSLSVVVDQIEARYRMITPQTGRARAGSGGGASNDTGE